MKIAIVKLSALGDIIHAASLLAPIVARLMQKSALKIGRYCAKTARDKGENG